MCFASILRYWRKMVQLLLNKTTPQILAQDGTVTFE